jgi:hypothetical protein
MNLHKTEELSIEELKPLKQEYLKRKRGLESARGKAKKKGLSAEQIIGKLKEAEVPLRQGSMVGEASRKLGVTEQTYYQRMREYGGMRLDQARRLKRLVADLTLDNAILKEATRGYF